MGALSKITLKVQELKKIINFQEVVAPTMIIKITTTIIIIMKHQGQEVDHFRGQAALKDQEISKVQEASKELGQDKVLKTIITIKVPQVLKQILLEMIYHLVELEEKINALKVKFFSAMEIVNLFQLVALL